MQESLAKFESSKHRLEVDTLNAKLETFKQRFELLDREKKDLHDKLNEKTLKFEELQHNYIQTMKDQSKVVTNDHVH
jgi:seryl-tRNA synthetase